MKMNMGAIPPVRRGDSVSPTGPDSRGQGQSSSATPEELLREVPGGDAVVISITGDEERQPEAAPPMEVEDAELQRFLRLLDDSNRQIEQAVKFWDRHTPKPVNVPSALGLNVRAASGKLGGSGLNVRQIRREYSQNVPEGHVVSQIPAPGGTSTRETGVTLVVSKGPPPENERYDIVKKQDRLPFLRIRSKREEETALQSSLRELHSTTAPDPAAPTGPTAEL